MQISKETESGKELTIRICGKNCLIGESLMFCKFTSHSSTAKALVNEERAKLADYEDKYATVEKRLEELKNM